MHTRRLRISIVSRLMKVHGLGVDAARLRGELCIAIGAAQRRWRLEGLNGSLTRVLMRHGDAAVVVERLRTDRRRLTTDTIRGWNVRIGGRWLSGIGHGVIYGAARLRTFELHNFQRSLEAMRRLSKFGLLHGFRG